MINPTCAFTAFGSPHMWRSTAQSSTGSSISINEIYLDLGAALAAVGLILAVYQLRSPRWDVVLRLRPAWQRRLVWVLSAIGLMIVMIRVLVTELAVPWLGPFGATYPYELIAYVCFIASPLSLVVFANRARNLFGKRRSRRFYEVMVQELSRSDPERLDAVLWVLSSNFARICKAARGPDDEETTQSARALLDVVLSDESVVKTLATKRLDALQYFLAIVKDQNISRRESRFGIPKVVHGLFYKKDSFFYKHLEHDGLALSWNIYETVFGTPGLMAHFRLFGYPTIKSAVLREVDIPGIRVIIEALSRSIETYLKTGAIPPRHINDGLSHLSDIFGTLCQRISTEERRGTDTKHSLKDEWWGVHLIAQFLGHDYLFVAYQDELNQTVVEQEQKAQEADFYSDETINAGIAAALYRGVENLSYIENTLDTYNTVLNLLNGVLREYEYKKGYREPFERRIWQQIAGNVQGRHYPAALRAYLEVVGFRLASSRDQGEGWIGAETERMRRLLYIDLKPLIDADTEMVNGRKMEEALLPTSMSYRDGRYFYTFGFGRGPEREIAPPPTGAASALEDVDPESATLL